MHTTPTQLITGSVDLNVIVWSLKTYEILTRIQSVSACSWRYAF